MVKSIYVKAEALKGMDFMNYEKSLWRDEFTMYTFLFEGRKAMVVFPSEDNRTSHWLLKTEYFDAFQDFEYEMVRRGFHLAYLQNKSRWVAEGDLEAKFRFRNFLMETFSLDARCVPVGMSCGGLHAVKQTAYFPEMISALYLDAPVVNLLSCPFGFGSGTKIKEEAKQEALTALGFTLSDMIAYRDHPLDHLEKLMELRIPVLLIVGDDDDIVPLDENGAHIVKAYRSSSLPFEYIVKPGCGHHPHGPDDASMETAIRFVEKYAGREP